MPITDTSKKVRKITVGDEVMELACKMSILNAPEIKIKNAVLAISDKYNGNFVDKYDVLINGESVLQTNDTEVDLSTLGLDAGIHNVNVKAMGENFQDSELSNSVDCTIEPLIPISSFKISGNTITDYVGKETVLNILGQYSFGELEVITYKPPNFNTLNSKISKGEITYPFNVNGIYNITTSRDWISNRTSIQNLFNEGEVIVTYEYTPMVNGTDYQITTIGQGAFEISRYDVTDITIPSSIVEIQKNGFNGIVANAITPPASLTFIGKSKLETIGEYAFQYCRGFTEINFPKSLKTIKQYAFGTCEELTTITFEEGSNLETIEENAFTECNKLTNITLPEGLKTIGGWAFGGIINKIVIPSTVTSIGTSIIRPTNLSSIIVHPENKIYDSRNNCNAIIETTTNKLILGCGNTVIPDGVANINDSAFAYCSTLTNIIIPDNVENIGAYTFYFCTKLSNIFIGTNSKLKIIGEGAVYNCGITSISLPASVTNIGNRAFAYCTNLIKIDFSSHTTIPTLDSSHVFDGIRSDCKIVVPDELYSQWIIATNWSALSSYIYKASEVTE